MLKLNQILTAFCYKEIAYFSINDNKLFPNGLSSYAPTNPTFHLAPSTSAGTFLLKWDEETLLMLSLRNADGTWKDEDFTIRVEKEAVKELHFSNYKIILKGIIS